ncbi:MAG TPA: serine/threonine-protein kinase, partial [Kofleriaceae bacterium]|nr:serine/threonine-protein kinase [Kofleriaceae bacterium]
MSGTLVGARYRLEHVLGEGGMGVVWAATELLTNELYALKLLKDDVEDPDARRRFGHEARAAQAVRHPNVVTIHGVIELEDERPAIVMELLHGETLRDVLSREHRLALAPLIELLAPVIAAVGAAHAQGVVHRDLKPENIFLARQPTGSRIVKILDFGIAKVTALDGETMRTTGLTTGKVLGTPAYMAPEQVYGQTDLDHRVDVWALGLVLYQALSGVLPTHGDNIGQVFRNVTARPFPPLDELAPGTPPEVTELVARMLARERADRPQDLREVIELLDGICPSTWQPFGPPAASLLAVGAAAHRPSVASPRAA